MKIVDENTVVEVGQYYLVKCAIMSNGKREYFLPVIGEIHNDKQFGFPHKHIHIDGRFCGETEKREIIIDAEGKTNQICTFPESRSEFTVKGFVNRKRKCKRLTTGIKPPRRSRFYDSPFYKWVESMKGKSCRGKKCPHLGTKMFEEDGILVCPLHNLISDENHDIIVGVKM
ncbi:hypothetical protein V2E39_17225 [Chryseobacterium arthrosphaerae]|uniref:Rieske domain-containing protein n=1 Tax=Chryseobacterium arthrosphaerae TaxID=651561 RepID=A0ABU7R337_9FLAO